MISPLEVSSASFQVWVTLYSHRAAGQRLHYVAFPSLLLSVAVNFFSKSIFVWQGASASPMDTEHSRQQQQMKWHRLSQIQHKKNKKQRSWGAAELGFHGLPELTPCWGTEYNIHCYVIFWAYEEEVVTYTHVFPLYPTSQSRLWVSLFGPNSPSKNHSFPTQMDIGRGRITVVIWPFLLQLSLLGLLWAEAPSVFLGCLLGFLPADNHHHHHHHVGWATS